MLTFETKSGTGNVETKWSELSPAQFVQAVALTNRFVTGEWELDEYRLLLLQMLTGYKRKSSRHKHADQINENLYRISEQLNFAVSPDIGPPEVLEFFSPELREALKTYFPWEIHEPYFVKEILTMQHLLKINFKVNFNLELNPLPFLRKGKDIFEGPRFSTENGDIDTNLKAGDYLNASEYFNAWGETKNKKYLNKFMDCLYKKISLDFSVADAEIPEWDTAGDAVIMLFIFMQQTFSKDPVFSILYQKGDAETPENKLYIGPDEVIGAMVESGYGTPDAIKNYEVITFFNFQIMFLKRNVAQLRGLNKNAAEIAKALNIPIETVQKL